jgi:hypothetical protein
MVGRSDASQVKAGVAGVLGRSVATFGNVIPRWKAHSGAMTDVSETAAETEELTHTFSESHRQDPPNRAHPVRSTHSEARHEKTASIGEFVKLHRLRELRGIRERNQPGGSGS